MNILVMGGTRFFGKMLVERLIAEGHAVTLVTRGRAPDPFEDAVERIVCERGDSAILAAHLKGRPFDVVYDQICFSPDDAKVACDLFKDADIGKYIFTSSVYVYRGQPKKLMESDFDPAKQKIEMGSRDALSYEEGKRRAEAYFSQKASFPVVSVRFPIVMGSGDYTGRFTHYISRLLSGQKIYLPHPQGKMNYVNGRDAADFLFWLKNCKNNGPVNAASDEAYDADQLLDLFADVLGLEPVMAREAVDSDELHYPYYREDDLVMDVSQAKSWGYIMPSFHDWFAAEVLAAKEALLAESRR